MPVPVLFPGRRATSATSATSRRARGAPSRPGDSRRGAANSTGRRVRASRGAVASSVVFKPLH